MFQEPSARMVAYLFLTGIAAGTLAVAVLVDYLGAAKDRAVVRGASRLGLALAVLCGLVVHLRLGPENRERPLHLESYRIALVDAARAGGPGTWDLGIFAAFCGLSMLLGRSGRALPGWRGWWRRGVEALVRGGAFGSACLLGSGIGPRFISGNASILGPELTWTGPLLLASSVTLGTAALTLWNRGGRVGEGGAAVVRLGRLEDRVIGLECLAGLALLASLGEFAVPVLSRWPGLLLPTFAVPVGWVLPLLVRRLAGIDGAAVAAVLTLVGGLALRVALLGTPGALLAP